MKKFFGALSFLVIVCLICGCHNAIYSKLKKQYPDSEIKKQGGGYEIVSENMDFEGLKINSTGVMDKNIYNDLEALQKSFNVEKTIVFLGKKTGESRQFIPVNKDGAVDDIYFTESKVEVIKSYYGDIQEGDRIIMLEYFAVFSDESGNKKINCLDTALADNDQRIFVLSTSSKSMLYDDTQNRYHNVINSIAVSAPMEDIKLYDQVYTNYYIKENTAVDKSELARSILEREQKKLNNANKYTETEIDQAKRGKAVLDSGASTYEQLTEGLTAEQKALIDRLAARYGEK